MFGIFVALLLLLYAQFVPLYFSLLIITLTVIKDEYQMDVNRLLQDELQRELKH